MTGSGSSSSYSSRSVSHVINLLFKDSVAVPFPVPVPVPVPIPFPVLVLVPAVIADLYSVQQAIECN